MKTKKSAEDALFDPITFSKKTSRGLLGSGEETIFKSLWVFFFKLDFISQYISGEKKNNGVVSSKPR